ncbi:MAG: cupin domain-containing protein [Betaproteobacteria bacterium]
MRVIDNTRLPLSSLPGIVHTTLAGSVDGLAHLSVWRQTIAPGAGTPPHRHACEEVVVVESGTGELLVAGQTQGFGPDSTLVIPGGVDHQILNTGTEPMHLVAAFSAAPVVVVLPDGNPIELPWRS